MQMDRKRTAHKGVRGREGSHGKELYVEVKPGILRMYCQCNIFHKAYGLTRSKKWTLANVDVQGGHNSKDNMDTHHVDGSPCPKCSS